MPICIPKSSCLSKFFLVSAFFLIEHPSSAQSPIHFQVEAQGIATTDQHVPLWMRARQGGAAPVSGLSGSLLGQVRKDYDTTRKKAVDWGVAFEGRANVGKEATELIVVQANAKLRLGMFEIRAGRWRRQVGLTDTLLSSGAFATSDNALGIPQVHLAIPEFYPLPFTNGWFSIKGAISHGWVGKVKIDNFYWVDQAETNYHHKQLYGRLGNPGGRLAVYAGFNHQAFWGNERSIFGPSFNLNTWQSYQSVLYGRNWAGSKVGNHAGSLDFGLGIRLRNSDLLAYRQFFYEAGGLAHFANVLDGLNGISLTNRTRRERQKQFLWEKIAVEILYSGDQGGKLTNPSSPTGAENYYNHYVYENGWSYKGRLLGNPLFTPVSEARQGQVSANQHIISNRLLAFHGGFTSSFGHSRLKVLATFSRNYGTFATSGEAYRLPFHNISPANPSVKFEPVSQFSGLIVFEHELMKKVSTNKLNSYVGATVGADTRGILNSSAGAMVKYGIRL
jgi:hypothetical protein